MFIVKRALSLLKYMCSRKKQHEDSHEFLRILTGRTNMFNLQYQLPDLINTKQLTFCLG